MKRMNDFFLTRRVGAVFGLALTLLLIPAAPALAADEPAGGAEMSQVVIATAGATIATAVLLWLALGHRSGRVRYLTRLAGFSERVSGLPGWAALPSAVSLGALLVAVLGMYWDISLHIDVGRDAGPLANPAHYLILIGLFGVFAGGVLAITLPRGDAGPAALQLAPGWPVPVGGVLIASAAAFALMGFPIDDIWHRLFGQDVTLWGPTHLMLIGGAGLTLVGMAVLLVEGIRARGPADREAPLAFLVNLRKVGLMGGLLIGLSTFQAEFDFGVPQFQMIFQPILIAVAAGVALVCARVWIGRGGAVGAVVFFLVIRGALSIIVGPVLGETTPSLPLYIGEALLVELAALRLADRPLALGAAAGLLIGTVGFAAEYGWAQLAMPIPWNEALLPAGPLLATVGAVAGGLIGALMGEALGGRLERRAVTRPVLAVSLLAVAALVANGLVTTVPENVRASVTLTEVRPAPQREVSAEVRIDPAQEAADARWLNITAWQGGGLVVDRLTPTGRGTYRTSEPIPVYGEWKATLRMQTGRSVLAVPVFMPEDKAIPAPEVPAPARFDREFVSDKEILQREAKQGVSPVLTTGAPLIVLAITLSLILILSLGLGRIGRPDEQPPRQRRERPPVLTTPSPAHGART
ncbi:MAG: hypothetical protein AABM29_10365 [Actinomycetota bacterium]